jgi:DNA-directed RNA polymerase subunit RPC12/RpoP
VSTVAPTLVVVCTRCGGLLLAKATQKTRECPHCSHTIIIEKAKKLASANTTNEASIMLRKLKSEAATRERGL